MNIIESIHAYVPFNEQEKTDQNLILRTLEHEPHVFDRSSVAHFSCSAFTVNPTHTRTLMVLHRLYRSWSWIGGHADNERDLASVALRELKEETGVCRARLIAPSSNSDIYSLEVLAVNGHLKDNTYVSTHLHLNVTYLIEASENEKLRISPRENSNVAWVDTNRMTSLSNERWLCENIYSKLLSKLGTIK